LHGATINRIRDSRRSCLWHDEEKPLVCRSGGDGGSGDRLGDGVDHWTQQERPDLVTAALLDFLAVSDVPLMVSSELEQVAAKAAGLRRLIDRVGITRARGRAPRSSW
jgi:hypothetical protein